MTDPERHPAKARHFLESAALLLANEFHEQAAQDAYLAAFHAALAYIAFRAGARPKTHSGTRSEFSRLAYEDAGVDRRFATFLARAYEMKSFADYADAPVARQDADEALHGARSMVAAIADRIR